MRHSIKYGYLAFVRALLLLGVLLVVACGQGKDPVVIGDGDLSTSVGQGELQNRDSATEVAKIRIVATTNILADWIESVGGERVEVHTIVPDGVDPHTFRLTPKEMTDMDGSQVGFFVGEHYEEGWIDSLSDVLLEDEATIVHLSEYVELRPYSADGFGGNGLDVGLGSDHEGHEEEHEGHEEEHEGHEEEHEGHEHGGEYDPHFWHDPITVVDAITRIALELSAVSPGDKSYFESNAEIYIDKLTQLDMWVMDKVGKIPSDKRIMITNHETMGYFADRYGFIVEDSIIPGLSSDATVVPKQLANIVDKIEDSEVGAVFGEAGMSEKIANAISEDAGVDIVYLYSESFGDMTGEENGAYNYIDMIKFNVNRIVVGLAE